MARQLVGSLSAEWQPDQYRDTYREQVLDYIKKKAKGKTVDIEHHEKERPAVVDLMEALRPSGIPPSDLDDEELRAELEQLYRTREDTFLNGTPQALEEHTHRMFELEK